MARARTVLLALLVVAALAAPAAARAPPRPACGVCTDALDEAAATHGVTVERAHSTLDVEAAANGTSTWTARVRLERGADALRANDTLRAAVVADARRWTVVDSPRALASRVDGDTLVVTYRAPNTSHVSLGVVRFDAFRAEDPHSLLPVAGGEGTVYPGADRLVLRAPDGYRVHGAYGDRSNASAVVWNGTGSIDRDTVVSFTRAADPLAGVRAFLVRWLP
ncbi:MAG: hypothetical protein ABEJ80_00190 [Halarchaeum sp.]